MYEQAQYGDTSTLVGRCSSCSSFSRLPQKHRDGAEIGEGNSVPLPEHGTPEKACGYRVRELQGAKDKVH